MASASGILVIIGMLALGLQATSSGAKGGNTTMDDMIDGLWIPQPLLPGSTPLTGHRSRSLDLSARACLPNGTNYCFGNDVNYCSGCGVCCQGSTNWCCSSGSICCGSQCCAEGQSCLNGRCYLPVVSITITSTSFITASHRLTQIATVVEDVVQTSTVNSIVEITISSLATQTDVQWVTTTVSDARRAVHSPEAAVQRDVHLMERGSFASLDLVGIAHRLAQPFRRSSNPINDRRGKAKDQNVKRQETEQALTAIASTTTIINYLTQTVDKTSILSSTTTRSATSTVLTTSYQTATRVLNADTTVSVTSTWTVHPPKPTTITRTEIVSPLTDSPASSSSAYPSSTPTLATSTSSHSGSGLSTPAIAGIAAGASVAGLLILAAALLICLKRRRRRRAAAAAISDDMDAYNGIAGGPLPPTLHYRREPKMPPVNIFAPTSPQHHGAAYQPVAQQTPDLNDPERANSSHTAATTLVGSATGGQGGGGGSGAKSPRTSSTRTGLSPPPVAEVAGPDVPPRYEIEGSSPPLGSPGAAGGGGGGHRRTGSDVTGRSRRSDGGYFAINF